MAAVRKYSSVSFFCPAHNEEENLPILIPKVYEFLKEISEKFEILIIENGSRDATPKIADDLAKQFSGVRAIHYPKGLGYGGAVREGFLNSKFEYICYTDSDNQYDVRELKEGFALLQDADIASGYVREKAVSLGRRIQSILWNILVRMLFGIVIRDINCSMKIYKRRVLDTIEIKSISAFIDAEMLVKAKRAGFVVKQFPVTHYERTSGVAIGSNYAVIWDTLRDALRFWRQTFKIEIFLFLAAFLMRAMYAFVIQAKSGMHGFISFSDAEYFYYAAAKNLLAHHAFSIAQNAPYYPDAYHTPLYPLFIAGLLAIHLSLLGVVLVQDVLAAVTVVLLYRIAIRLSGSSAVAIVAGVLAAIEPMSIYWSGLLMSDVFFAFIMTVSFYYLQRDRWAASGIALGLATLVRPIGLFFVPAYLLFIAYCAYNGSLKRLWQPLAVFVISFALIISPWLVRNKILFDAWSLTSGGWYDLYVESVSPFALQKGIPLPTVAAVSFSEKDFTRFSFEYTPELQAADLAVIRADVPGYLLYQAGRSLWAMFSNRYEYLMHVVIKSEMPYLYMRLPSWLMQGILSAGEMFWVAIYVLFVLAFAEKRSRIWWLFAVLLIGINAIISGGINPGGADMSRYSLPFYPFFFSFAGTGLAFFLQEIRGQIKDSVSTIR